MNGNALKNVEMKKNINIYHIMKKIHVLHHVVVLYGEKLMVKMFVKKVNVFKMKQQQNTKFMMTVNVLILRMDVQIMMKCTTYKMMKI